MASFRRELSFGATLVEPDRTRFRLYAPAQPQVTVEIQGHRPAAMSRCDGGRRA